MDTVEILSIRQRAELCFEATLPGKQLRSLCDMAKEAQRLRETLAGTRTGHSPEHEDHRRRTNEGRARGRFQLSRQPNQQKPDDPERPRKHDFLAIGKPAEPQCS